MKMSRGKWIFACIVVFIIAAVGLYIPYNNEKNLQKQIEKDISGLQQRVLLLTLNKNILEKEIARLNAEKAAADEESVQKQAEIDNLQNELNKLIIEREEAVSTALSNLTAVQSIYTGENGDTGYSELLFKFAGISEIVLNSFIMTDTDNITINGVSYYKTSIDLSVSGARDNILNFISKIQSEDAFRTAFFDNILIYTPLPLTELEKADIYSNVISEFELDAISRFTIDEIVDFIILGLAKVTSSSLNVPDVEEMAQGILSVLANLVATKYEVPLAYNLAEIIKQHISEWIVDEVINTLAVDIANAITGGSDQAALTELFGADIAALLGDRLANTLPAEIAELLKGYVSSEIDLAMSAAALPLIEDEAGVVAANRIKQLEASTCELSLVIYTYREVE